MIFRRIFDHRARLAHGVEIGAGPGPEQVPWLIPLVENQPGAGIKSSMDETMPRFNRGDGTSHIFGKSLLVLGHSSCTTNEKGGAPHCGTGRRRRPPLGRGRTETTATTRAKVRRDRNCQVRSGAVPAPAIHQQGAGICRRRRAGTDGEAETWTPPLRGGSFPHTCRARRTNARTKCEWSTLQVDRT